jgi:hypothetical protein
MACPDEINFLVVKVPACTNIGNNILKANHRAAFANDPKLLARIEAQLAGKQAVEPRTRVPAVIDTPPSPGVKKGESTATKRMRRVQEQNMESRFDSVTLCHETGAMTVVLAGGALLSLNVSLRVFDAKATKLKNTWKERIKALRYENQTVFNQWKATAQYPVIVEEVYITAESACLDSESVCAACKPIIDAFVTAGFLPDDDPQHILHPIPLTRRGENSGIVLRFFPAPTEHGLISKAAMQAALTIPPIFQ